MDSNKIQEKININIGVQNIADRNGFYYSQHNDGMELTWAGQPEKPLLEYILADDLVVLSRLEKHTARVLEAGLRGLNIRKREGQLSTGGFCSLAITVSSLRDMEKLSEAVDRVFSQKAASQSR